MQFEEHQMSSAQESSEFIGNYVIEWIETPSHHQTRTTIQIVGHVIQCDRIA